jgi:hypothetical protein
LLNSTYPFAVVLSGAFQSTRAYTLMNFSRFLWLVKGTYPFILLLDMIMTKSMINDVLADPDNVPSGMQQQQKSTNSLNSVNDSLRYSGSRGQLVSEQEMQMQYQQQQLQFQQLQQQQQQQYNASGNGQMYGGYQNWEGR